MSAVTGFTYNTIEVSLSIQNKIEIFEILCILPHLSEECIIQLLQELSKGEIKMIKSEITAHIPCPIEKIWDIVTNLHDTTWRSDLKKVEILSEKSFVEYTNGGYATKFTITDCRPPYFWAFDMENGNMTGHWEGHFVPDGDGTRLTFTEHVSPKHWWMRPLIPGYLKKQQKLYMDDLRRELLK